MPQQRHTRRLFYLCFILWFWPNNVAAASQPPPTIPLRITEVYYNTPGVDKDKEWIEITNLGDELIDLSDIKIGDATGSGSNEGMARFPEAATIAPEQVIIVAQSATGYQALFGQTPTYEIRDTDPTVPDMRAYRLWANGAVGLANGGDEVVLLNKANGFIDGVNYGDKTTLFDPAVLGVFTGQSIERVPANCDTDAAADWQPQENPTPGELQFTGECTTPIETLTLLPIGQIQGHGPVALRVNETVSFRGVVTGFYRDRNTTGQTYSTLFVQDIPGHEDGDPTTSDGLALFLGQEQAGLQLGDHLLVTGRVTEFFGFTELEDDGLEITVESRGNPLPTPIEINPPADNEGAAAYLEPYESMRVTLPASLIIGPTIATCSFAVIRLDTGLTRILRHSASDPIGQIIPILHTNDINCAGFPQVKTGDQVTGLVGPLIYHFDQFKLVHQDAAALTIIPTTPQPAPTAPARLPHQISIASFNMENYFDAQDDTGTDEEPKPLPVEIRLKQTKLAYAIAVTLDCPTLIGVVEVEKESLLVDLAVQVAEMCGFTYTVSHRESTDARGIDVALLSDPRLVQIQDIQLRQTCASINTGITDPIITCTAGQQPLFSRPPLQVDLKINEQPVTLFINHFKSKRGGEDDTEPERLAQAAHVNQMVTELTNNGQTNLIVMGDFNDYFASPTLQKLAESGLSNALALVPAEERYSYVFSGASQLIDGLFLSPLLTERIATATILHVNANYPDILTGDTTPSGLPHQVTDHDLPLVLLDWDWTSPGEGQIMPTPTRAEEEKDVAAAASPSMLWPGLIGGFAILITLATLIWRRRTNKRHPASTTQSTFK
ncbi:MAG: lamin tail domain-containing protein [Chloroflexi bacterium]|nr:lamin tail domain-containing protein [Chloroflexota bacterium]